jgi:hypothetical protein
MGAERFRAEDGRAAPVGARRASAPQPSSDSARQAGGRRSRRGSSSQCAIDKWCELSMN